MKNSNSTNTTCGAAPADTATTKPAAKGKDLRHANAARIKPYIVFDAEGNYRLFTSWQEAAAWLNINKRSFFYILLKGKSVNGYCIDEYITDNERRLMVRLEAEERARRIRFQETFAL